MSKITNNGGPAFPQPPHTSQNGATGEVTNYQWTSDGMSMRQFYAAHAPITLSDANDMFYKAYGRNPLFAETMENLAEIRFRYADAMIRIGGAE